MVKILDLDNLVSLPASLRQALNSLICADVPLRNRSLLTHCGSLTLNFDTLNNF